MMTTVALQKKGMGFFLLVGLLGCLSLAGQPASVSASGYDPFIGEISCGGWNFCPNGWAECSGQLVPIAENEALFTLLGTTYGGDGQVSFALPNLSGRTMLGTGTGSGLSMRILGETAGSETVTLTANQIPVHNHALLAQAEAGNSASPAGKVIAGVPASDARYAATHTGTLANGSVGVAVGGSQPHNNLQPYLAVKCCIALYGIFPTQN